MSMARQRVFLTGATGSMGRAGMEQLLLDADRQDLVILALPDEASRELLAGYAGREGLEIVWGDLTDYPTVLGCVRGADIVLHVGALVSPEADNHPQRTMEVNYGSTMNILTAIAECGQDQTTRLVFIGTVAQTGDRMPPIHWGRVGDPLKPSVYDYYAVSKIAAERAVIESGLARWVSLRQTAIMSRKMTAIEDPIMFHNPLDNVFEYVSDRDSAVLAQHLPSVARGVLEPRLQHLRRPFVPGDRVGDVPRAVRRPRSARPRARHGRQLERHPQLPRAVLPGRRPARGGAGLPQRLDGLPLRHVPRPARRAGAGDPGAVPAAVR
ncbi:MAG: NAD-dependent epimerase/dehydratase family protein [Propionibacteriaceae bacterium]|nr:NAD-dependent epimerase/dehydratase family protein [Propionibacteriaceae bacterium]